MIGLLWNTSISFPQINACSFIKWFFFLIWMYELRNYILLILVFLICYHNSIYPIPIPCSIVSIEYWSFLQKSAHQKEQVTCLPGPKVFPDPYKAILKEISPFKLANEESRNYFWRIGLSRCSSNFTMSATTIIYLWRTGPNLVMMTMAIAMKWENLRQCQFVHSKSIYWVFPFSGYWGQK